MSRTSSVLGYSGVDGYTLIALTHTKHSCLRYVGLFDTGVTFKYWQKLTLSSASRTCSVSLFEIKRGYVHIWAAFYIF